MNESEDDWRDNHRMILDYLIRMKCKGNADRKTLHSWQRGWDGMRCVGFISK